MSLERARVNCERCYVIASKITRTKLDKSDPDEDPYVASDQLYAARNEAMKALEDSQRDCRALVSELGVKLEQTESGVATAALRACGRCTYHSPKIVNVIDGTEGEER